MTNMPRYDLLKDFTQAVRSRRKTLRLTQAELANMAGISRTYLSMLEQGVATNPSYDMVLKLSRVLSLETFDKPERTFTASCYLCLTYTSLQMLPHRKEGHLIGWIFACATCAPQLYGTELTAHMPAEEDTDETHPS